MPTTRNNTEAKKAAPAAASPSPPPPSPQEDTPCSPSSSTSSPEPLAVFDMEELDRLLSAAIQMNIHDTPPPEVSKAEKIPAILANE